MMGIFSIFCGLIYNEFFSFPLLIFDSCYEIPSFKRVPNCSYPIGLDWIWAQSSNETAFINSFKMKFSIVIGVIHMLFGTTLKALNAIHFNSYVDLFWEAIP